MLRVIGLVIGAAVMEVGDVIAKTIIVLATASVVMPWFF
jgi:hypothetical protein